MTGGYHERLPLACVKAGLADRAEIWHHRGAGQPGWSRREHALLTRRAFPLDRRGAPVASGAMRRFVERFGAPAILVVLGLGVDEALLEACRDSFILYNSIDAPALRVPDAVARHFDLVLTGAHWQSDEVARRVPGVATAILPIGPEFAATDLFRPLGTAKTHDLIYVAAAQGYKRHDILFDALERLPRTVRALCVFGYGEMAGELRGRAAAAGLNVDFIGPPGVPFAAVNPLMNCARIGVVCGVDDGAPAILTEYMLAGLPVLANAALTCGLQYIRPDTGMTAPADRFAEGIVALLDRADTMNPRNAALQHWTWAHSMVRLNALIHASYMAVPAV